MGFRGFVSKQNTTVRRIKLTDPVMMLIAPASLLPVPSDRTSTFLTDHFPFQEGAGTFFSCLPLSVFCKRTPETEAGEEQAGVSLLTWVPVGKQAHHQHIKPCDSKGPGGLT